ncbi:MAG: DUF4174 domain-containing protein [Pseudomonadota bacterium]
MTRAIAFILVNFLGLAAFAADGSTEEGTLLERWEADRTQVFDAAEVSLDDLKWLARPLVVFANSSADPAFIEQMELLTEGSNELEVRDVILITDTSPDARSELRTKLRPRGFQLTLIGKDGGVKLRKPFPWDVRELSRQIDKMPIRQQEIRDSLRAAE